MQPHSRRDNFLPSKKTRSSCGLGHILLQPHHPIQSRRLRISNWYVSLCVFFICLLMPYFYYYCFSLKIVFGLSFWQPPLLAWPWQLHLRRQRHSMFLLVSRNFRCLFPLEVLWKELLNVMGKLSLNLIQRTLRSKLTHHLITLTLSSLVPLRIDSVECLD